MDWLNKQIFLLLTVPEVKEHLEITTECRFCIRKIDEYLEHHYLDVESFGDLPNQEHN
jgi:hypothetical protein